MLGNNYAFSACYVCELHAMSTSSTSIEYYKQQYCTSFIGCLGHLAVKLVELSIAHISCSVVYWVETWKWWSYHFVLQCLEFLAGSKKQNLQTKN